jgi:hypothetical protein
LEICLLRLGLLHVLLRLLLELLDHLVFFHAPLGICRRPFISVEAASTVTVAVIIVTVLLSAKFVTITIATSAALTLFTPFFPLWKVI